MPVGQPLKFKSVTELQQKIDEYFELEGEQPTITGLALHLDTNRQTLINYENKDGYIDTIKKAKMRVEKVMEQKLYGHNVTGMIFNLKNNFGWKDKTEVEQNVNASITTTNEQTAADYAEFLKTKQ